ncbi:MAG: hypothetical protein AB3N63_17155 [Puniceicoccaceae bacterium]
MKIRTILILFLTALLFTACANVDITKTGKGYTEPTNPNDIEILMTVPTDRKYVELGSITVSGFKANQEAKMHNALRAKSSPLGADAVILNSRGITPGGLLTAPKIWATGVAIRFED